MTPEEYQRLKDAEKEHLTKLKELKKAVRVLERQKKIQSELEKMSRVSDDALQAQSEAVERLALETALQEARLDVAMDSEEASASALADEALEDELRNARAQTLVERLKQSMTEGDEMGEDDEGGDADEANASPVRPATPHGTSTAKDGPANASSKAGTRKRDETERQAGGAPANPTPEGRPEKTIGRM